MTLGRSRVHRGRGTRRGAAGVSGRRRGRVEAVAGDNYVMCRVGRAGRSVKSVRWISVCG